MADMSQPSDSEEACLALPSSFCLIHSLGLLNWIRSGLYSKEEVLGEEVERGWGEEEVEL